MFLLLLIMCGDRRLVLMIKLQCPDHTFYIIGVDFPGTDRINIQKHLVQIFISLLCSKLFQLLTVSVFLLCLSKINILCNSLYIKSGSSYQNRNFPLGINFFHGSFCHLLEFHDMKFFLRQQFIYQIMLYSLHLLRPDLS